MSAHHSDDTPHSPRRQSPRPSHAPLVSHMRGNRGRGGRRRGLHVSQRGGGRSSSLALYSSQPPSRVSNQLGAPPQWSNMHSQWGAWQYPPWSIPPCPYPSNPIPWQRAMGPSNTASVLGPRPQAYHTQFSVSQGNSHSHCPTDITVAVHIMSLTPPDGN